MTIDLILAEFGKQRRNAGDATLPPSRLEPAVSSFRKFLGSVNVILYTDQAVEERGADIRIVEPPFDQNHPRYGWRCNDYFQLFGLLESRASVAIATDADMLVVSQNVKTLIPMALRFGLLAPHNPRLLVRNDMRSVCDGSDVIDATAGMGSAYNGSPYVLGARRQDHLQLIREYLEEMRTNPCRGPIAMWRAVWKTGIFPYMTAPQFCVCRRHEDIDNPCIVHVGHHNIRRKFMPLD